MYDKKCAAEIFKRRFYQTPRSRVLEDMTIKRGLKHKIFTARKDYYKGEWKDDMKDGWGLYLANDKLNNMYEGQWKKHHPEGYGVRSICDDDGKCRIVVSGSWKNGKPDGKTFSYQNGNYFEGMYQEGKKQGYGRIWYKNGDFYEGLWKNGKKHGFGIIAYKNGNRYEGEWYEGIKQGGGILYHFKTGQAQEGIWIENRCVTSTMRDIQYRQGSDEPTQYPIPETGLKDWFQVYIHEYDIHADKLLKMYQRVPTPDIECEDNTKCICRMYKNKCK